MAKVPHIGQFKYKRGVLIRSAAMSWRPGKWPLGRGASATVAPGPSGLLGGSTFLTVTTPEGEVIVMETWSRGDAGRAHKMAAEINTDAARAAA